MDGGLISSLLSLSSSRILSLLFLLGGTGGGGESAVSLMECAELDERQLISETAEYIDSSDNCLWIIDDEDVGAFDDLSELVYEEEVVEVADEEVLEGVLEVVCPLFIEGAEEDTEYMDVGEVTADSADFNDS